MRLDLPGVQRMARPRLQVLAKRRAEKLMHQHMDDVNSSLRRLYPGIGSDVMDWE